MAKIMETRTNYNTSLASAADKIVFFATFPFKIFLVLFLLCASYIYRKTVLKLYIVLSGISRNPNYELVTGWVPPLTTKNNVSFMVVLCLKAQGKPDIEKLRQRFVEKVIGYETSIRSEKTSSTKPYKPFERLLWRIDTLFLVDFWIKCENFRIENHVLQNTVNSPKELDSTLHDLGQEYLQRRRVTHIPDWEVRLVSVAGTSERENSDYGLIIAVSHAYTDGTSLMQLLRYGLCDTPFHVKMDPLDASKPTREAVWKAARWSDILRQFGSQQKISIQHQYDTKSLWMRQIRPRTEITVGKKIHLENIKRLRSKVSLVCTTTAIYKAAVCNAMQEIIFHSKGREPEKVPFYCISTFANYPYASLELTNNISVALTPLCTGGEDALDRIKKQSKYLEETASPLGLAIMEKLLALNGVLLKQFLPAFYMILSPIIGISNLVGPEHLIHLFESRDVVTSMAFYSSLGPTVRTVVYLVSYNGFVRPTAVVDSDFEECFQGIKQFGKHFDKAMEDFFNI